MYRCTATGHEPLYCRLMRRRQHGQVRLRQAAAAAASAGALRDDAANSTRVRRRCLLLDLMDPGGWIQGDDCRVGGGVLCRRTHWMAA